MKVCTRAHVYSFYTRVPLLVAHSAAPVAASSATSANVGSADCCRLEENARVGCNLLPLRLKFDNWVSSKDKHSHGDGQPFGENGAEQQEESESVGVLTVCGIWHWRNVNCMSYVLDVYTVRNE